jgi:organic radical activating enzyme
MQPIDSTFGRGGLRPDSGDYGQLDHRDLYRLPWTLPDNAISWLEPTAQCNLSCDGCYRANVRDSHKSMDQIKAELEIFKRLRRCDSISIAGGDPLMHPDIVEIVRLIAADGLKPVVNTNGVTLTKELLRELRKAGVTGFTFHIDSKQGRPHWKDKNEIELNELRLQYAEMLAEVGGISCAFNSTVYEDTLRYVPDIVKWAEKHIDIVHVVVFIAFRAAVPDLPFDWFAGGRKIEMGPLPYSTRETRRINILSTDMIEVIRRRFPDFRPCAFLNGTEESDSFKWLLTGRVGARGRIYGYVGPRFMEMMQTMHHLLYGRYLAYAKPSLLRKGRTMMLLSPLDKGMSIAARSYLGEVLRNPYRLFEGLHYQSIMIIQPVDFLADGSQNMCDGCPDITVWNGRLVWSCRLEEQLQFGCFVRTVPKMSDEMVHSEAEK